MSGEFLDTHSVIRQKQKFLSLGKEIEGFMATVITTKAQDGKKPARALPAPNSDFYELMETLPAEELEVVKQVRAFMETKVAPIITKYWVEDAFPFELLPAIKELNIGGVALKGYGSQAATPRSFGLSPLKMPPSL